MTDNSVFVCLVCFFFQIIFIVKCILKVSCCSGRLCVISEIAYIVLFFLQISYWGSMGRIPLILGKK